MYEEIGIFAISENNIGCGTENDSVRQRKEKRERERGHLRFEPLY